MWSEIIRIVNLDGKYACIKCGKDVEHGKEGIDFEYVGEYYRKQCTECSVQNAITNKEG